MIQIGDKLISRELLEEKFLCDLGACKGACCVAGDAGAPLLDEEREILVEIYPKVKKYLNKKSKDTIAERGNWVIDDDGEYVTPLNNGDEECTYVVFENGIAMCAIEKAWRAGEISFPKPISCHLYPVRIKRFKKLKVDGLNYDRWDICSAACVNGAKLKMPVYKFVKDGLIRKYGKAFYSELEEIAINFEERVSKD